MNFLDIYKKLRTPKSHMIIFLMDGEDSDSAQSETIETFRSYDNAVARRNVIANSFPYAVIRKQFPKSELAICTIDSYFGKKYL